MVVMHLRIISHMRGQAKLSAGWKARDVEGGMTPNWLFRSFGSRGRANVSSQGNTTGCGTPATLIA